MPNFDADKPRRSDYQADFGALNGRILTLQAKIDTLSQQLNALAGRPTTPPTNSPVVIPGTITLSGDVTGPSSDTAVNEMRNARSRTAIGAWIATTFPTLFANLQAIWTAINFAVTGILPTATVDTMFSRRHTGTSSSIGAASALSIANAAGLQFLAGEGCVIRYLEDAAGEGFICINRWMDGADTLYTANFTATGGEHHRVNTGVLGVGGAITVLVPNVTPDRVAGREFTIELASGDYPVTILRNPAFPGTIGVPLGWAIDGPVTLAILSNPGDCVTFRSVYSSNSSNYSWVIVAITFTPPWNVLTVTGNTTSLSRQHRRCNTASGNQTQTLPLAADSLGQDVTYTKVTGDANTVSFTGQGGDTVTLPSWITNLSAQGQWITFRATGSALWEVVGYGVAPMVGATSGSNGAAGIATKPLAGDDVLPLHGDATYKQVVTAGIASGAVTNAEIASGAVAPYNMLNGSSVYGETYITNGSGSADIGDPKFLTDAMTLSGTGFGGRAYGSPPGPGSLQNALEELYAMGVPQTVGSVYPALVFNYGGLFDPLQTSDVPIWVDRALAIAWLFGSDAGPTTTAIINNYYDFVYDGNAITVDLPEVTNYNLGQRLKLHSGFANGSGNLVALTPFSGQYLYLPGTEVTSGRYLSTWTLGPGFQAMELISVTGGNGPGWRIESIFPLFRTVDTATAITFQAYDFLRTNSTGGNRTHTLPDALNNLSSRVRYSKTVAANTVDVTPSGTDVVHGTTAISAQWATKELVAVDLGGGFGAWEVV